MSADPAARADSRNAAKARLLRVNEGQRDYYAAADGTRPSEVNNAATNLWRTMRQRAQVSLSGAARRRFYALHRDWMGALGPA